MIKCKECGKTLKNLAGFRVHFYWKHKKPKESESLKRLLEYIDDLIKLLSIEKDPFTIIKTISEAFKEVYNFTNSEMKKSIEEIVKNKIIKAPIEKEEVK